MTLVSSAIRFARSPHGRRLTQQAIRMAQDPKTKAKLAEARRKLAEDPKTKAKVDEARRRLAERQPPK